MSDTDEVDRLTTGMLYAGAAGIMIGGSIAQYSFTVNSLFGAFVLMVALGYETHQRLKHGGSNETN